MATKRPPEKFSQGWLADLDSRTNLAQTMRARYRELTDDLGGVDHLSYQQRSLVERSLWLEYWLAQQERDLAEGREFDAGKWTQACNALHGLYSKLGLKRQTRDVVSLADFVRRKGDKA